MHSQTLYVQLTAAAPLHIGCSEVYEPTSFVIDQAEKELVYFDTGRFLNLLDSDALAKFSAICRKGTPASLIELMKFMRSQARDILISIEAKRIPVVKALAEHYKQTLNLPLHDKRKVDQELNRFQIMRTAFDSLSGEVYIPGSAIKGAIRTAVLNLRNNGRAFPDFKGKSRNLEEHLLESDFRHMESDPFRLIKVSDFFPLGKAKTRIIYAIDRKKRQSKFEARAPYQIVEVVGAETQFIGTISVFDSFPHGPVKKPVTPEEIRTALHTFYGKEKQREDRELESIGIKPVPVDINGQRIPLRVGRHAGAECVTVEGHRYIKIMQGGHSRPKFLDHATTVWLASDNRNPGTTENLQAFGWAILEMLEHDKFETLKAQVEKKRLLFQEQQKIKAEAWEREQSAKVAQHERELREKEEKEKELAARQEQEEKFQAQWDAMSEQDRDLACIRQEEVALKYASGDARDPIPNIWPKLNDESIPPEHQKALALAFRERWQAENKWKVKPKKKKQWKKVQRVKEILGKG